MNSLPKNQDRHSDTLVNGVWRASESEVNITRLDDASALTQIV